MVSGLVASEASEIPGAKGIEMESSGTNCAPSPVSSGGTAGLNVSSVRCLASVTDRRDLAYGKLLCCI